MIQAAKCPLNRRKSSRLNDDIPEEDAISVYVDRAFSRRTQVAGCGGVLSRGNGATIESFLCRIEGRDSLTAEIWGCIWGLRRAWDNGFRMVRLLTDCTELISLCNSEDVHLHEDESLIRELQSYLRRDWTVQLRYINRNENKVADLLAKEALSMGFGLQILSNESTGHLLLERGTL
ncbi:uncharacterized protein LOC114746076 [Neltuma alba]|uniref:uncharacterized protein LOC114746076 n=1 Tax=Neltuma alba TaxID=207710 RepID=UPI0010A44938|nr:uncharacterized protein LOC114746076 [Prosopis alba]